MENFLEETKKIVSQIMEIIGIEGEIVVEEKETGTTINITTSEAGFLIGQSGANLYSLQHLVRLMVGKKLGEEKPPNFVIDVNNYRRGRADMLRDLAIEKANQAASERMAMSLYPMTAYERRLIHMALQDRKDVMCESEGEGQERHIVIRPA